MAADKRTVARIETTFEGSATEVEHPEAALTEAARTAAARAKAERAGAERFDAAHPETQHFETAHPETAHSDTEDAERLRWSKYREALVRLIRQDEWTMDLLRNVRSLGLDDWCVAAGAIRNLVWDDVHSHVDKTYPGDIDVLIYDQKNTDPAYEAGLEHQLTQLDSRVRWEVTNQATIHTYVGDEVGYCSIEHAMSRWADLVTAVGAWLDDADVLTVVAPGGLGDLFELRVRPNLVTPTSAATYHHRMTSKGWQERWPKLDIEMLPWHVKGEEERV